MDRTWSARNRQIDKFTYFDVSKFLENFHLGVLDKILPKIVFSRVSIDAFRTELTKDKSEPSSKKTA